MGPEAGIVFLKKDELRGSVATSLENSSSLLSSSESKSFGGWENFRLLEEAVGESKGEGLMRLEAIAREERGREWAGGRIRGEERVLKGVCLWGGA